MLVAALINGTKVCVCVFSCTSHTEYQNSPGILVGVEVGATVGVWVANESPHADRSGKCVCLI